MRLPCYHLTVLFLLCSLGSCKPPERSTLSRPRAKPGPKEPGFTRMKRKNLAVDFVIPAAFRNSLRDLLGLFPAGAVNTNFQASSSLAMDCWPLVGSLEHPGRILVDMKREQKPAPLSKVLKSGFLKSLRRSKQLLLEVGEEMIREGCGLSLASEIPKEGKNDRFEEQEDPQSLVLKRKLEFDLAELFSWWLKSKEGRLRIRLMPQRSASFPGREDILSAALRASQPRLTFQILRKVVMGEFARSSRNGEKFAKQHRRLVFDDGARFFAANFRGRFANLFAGGESRKFTTNSRLANKFDHHYFLDLGLDSYQSKYLVLGGTSFHKFHLFTSIAKAGKSVS
ncbi:hypothetical protein XELAEV_18026323mg [Xenopus laevis]|uniref:Uncharacterized protein n=1 Tax=Xenopus laevis TaxID=8355 RepID=A0A974CUA4_XENLA|nr:hypothetical protein XELAEV_18026323mg [Xenopus laevis]